MNKTPKEIAEIVILDIKHEIYTYARSINLPPSVIQDIYDVIESCNIGECNSSLNKPETQPDENRNSS
jgi:hypothetical protein